MERSPRDIAGYRLVAGLGEGGMARVYLALSRKAAGFSKLVVLKVLRSSSTEDPAMRRMFFDEARVAALLNHPNVVQTYEAGDDEGRLFLAMEYLEGRSLSALLMTMEIPLDVHLRIIADMLEGLHYAHGVSDVDGTPLDIVHRDVSPQNVLVTFAGQSKVVDFGIAKIAGSPATQSGVIKGKVNYMSPEQIHNKGVDRRADVFAAGVMLWEAIARRRMMQRGEDEVTILARRMNGEDPSIRTVAPPDTPEELLAICEKAMHHDPEQRYETALDLHNALHRFLRRTNGADQKRVAEMMNTAFAAERSQTRAFVEEQMRVADHSSPLIDIARKRVVNPPSLPPMPVLVASGRDVTKTAQITDLVPTRPRSPLVPVLVGLLAVGLLLSGFAVARVTRTPAPADSAAAAAAPVPSVRLSVRTSAEDATLLVNEEPHPLPYEARFARGSDVHLVARAPGFVDYDRHVTMTDDTGLEIAMSRVAPPPPPPAPPAVSTAPPAAPKPKPRRAIDDGDPYRR